MRKYWPGSLGRRSPTAIGVMVRVGEGLVVGGGGGVAVPVVVGEGVPVGGRGVIVRVGIAVGVGVDMQARVSEDNHEAPKSNL